MKKTLIVAAALVATSLASFGQGSFLFSGPSKGIWDNYSVQNVGKISGETLDVAFLVGTGTPLIASIATSVATNAATTSFGTSFANATAWSDILSDPNFSLATSGGTNVQASVVGSNGSFVAEGGSSFLVTGTTAGATYTVYTIAWNSAYATPALASAAHSAVGWSAAFSYVSGNPGGLPPTSPQTYTTSVTPFGVVPGVGPEPGTIALAGMGIASLLAFRRRNSK